MTRTITAMYDSRPDAEAARDLLEGADIASGKVQILDQSAGGSGESGGGFWSSIKEAFMPDDDRHAYEEGVRRGGYLLCAQVEESRADEAIRLIEGTNSVDFDQRQESWKNEGRAPYSAAGAMRGAGERTSEVVEEEHIPVVEERLMVGKREVNRGGARVRSYIRETPVQEQVQLRDEHVSVERRPVDQPLGAADLRSGDLLQERTVEMTETDEEAVVGKEARVTEEVVVRKTTEEHVENVQDTVRRTEVEVDEGAGGGSAFGFSGGGNASDASRSEFERSGPQRDR